MNLIQRLVVAMAAFAAAASAETILLPTVRFILDPPSGFVEGAAGTSVGWGYTIGSTSNGSPAFVFIAGFSFGDTTPIGNFLYDPLAVPSSAATDGSSITALWSLNSSGLQYDIDRRAQVGWATTGFMTLTYDVYSDAAQSDPPIAQALSVNAQFGTQDVNAEVFVNAPAAAVPEPGAVTLFVLGTAGLLLRKRSAAGPLRRPAAAGRPQSS